MSKLIYLKLDTNKGIMTIPFKGIEEVDSFTVAYNTKIELAKKIIRILSLNLDPNDVISIYLSFDKYNMGVDEDSLPVKYSGDNFNFESLHDVLVSHIMGDLSVILRTHLRYVKTREMNKYFETGTLDVNDVDRIVRAFFDKNGYKRKRDTYFWLKNEENVDIKIESIKNSSDGDCSSLSVYSTGEDNFLNHLIEASKRREGDFDKIMDELRQQDLEELRGLIYNGSLGIIDGLSDDELSLEGEIAALEEYTGLSVTELRKNHSNFGRRRKPRR